MALRDILEHVFQALSLSAGVAPAASDEIKRVLDEFREERANDIASLADRAGRSGARLASMERDRDAWRAYARELERLCLAEGISLPAAPDEDGAG